MSSVKGDILAACLAALQGAALDGVAQIAVRKHPLAIKESDAFPLLIISPEKESWQGGMYGRDELWSYPVLCTLAVDGLVLHDPAYQTGVREEIRTALIALPLAGAPTVWDVDYDAEPDFDPGAVKAGLDVSGQRFVFASRDGGNV